MKELTILKKLILIKLINQKSVCHYNYFNDSFKFASKVCNGYNWGIESFRNFAIITVNDVDYRGFVWYDKMMWLTL